MSEDTSGHDAFAAALSGTDAPQIEGTVEAEVIDQGQGGDGQGTAVQPEPTGTGAPSAQQDRNEGMVPSWRLREISEQREAERRERAQEQRELNELREFRKEQEAERARKEQEAALQTEDFYSGDPAQFIDKRFDHNTKKALTPIEQRIQKIEENAQRNLEDYSRELAEEKFGRDNVAAAWQRVHQAILSGDPEALAFKQSLTNARHPYGDLVAFDKRRSTLEAIGGDLEGYTKKQREEALKDPEFLQRAIEAHRSMATPVQTGVPGRAQPSAQPRGTLPSLNRQTSAADDGAESEDENAVFQDALRTPRR